MILLITHNLAILLCICSLANALARSDGPSTRSPYMIKEYHQVPKGWSQVGHAPAWHEIQLNIGLAQGQFAELERHLYEGK